MSAALFASTMPFMSLISASLSSAHPRCAVSEEGSSRISFQLVLVQILILKGGLNRPRLRQDERKEQEGGRRGEKRNRAPAGLTLLFSCLPCN